MISVSDKYKKIVANRGHVSRWSVSVGGKEIPSYRVKAFPALTMALYTDALSFGNAVSSCLELTYLPYEAPPRGAEVRISVTVCEDDSFTESKSERCAIGLWRINSRSTDKHGWMTVQCYDDIARLDKYTVRQAAKKTEYALTYPVSVSQIIDLMEALTNVAFDSYSRSLLSDVVGLTKEETKELKLREALGYAALQNGVNIVYEGGFRAKACQEGQFDAFYIDTQDNNVGGEQLVDHDGEPIVFMDWTNARQTIRPEWAGDVRILGEYGPISAVKVTGKDSDDASNDWTADYNLFDGTTLEVNCPMDNAGSNVAYAILDKVERFTYTGWSASSVLFDPTIEAGDPLMVNGKPCIVAEIKATLGPAYIADCGAAANYEIKGEI